MAEETMLPQLAQEKSVLGTERRIWLRFANTQDMSGASTTTSIKDKADTAWFGTIRNVSPTGIALSISKRFELGTALIVELSAKPEGVLRLPVRVVHATPDKKDRWVIGCTFASPLTDAELETFLGD